VCKNNNNNNNGNSNKNEMKKKVICAMTEDKKFLTMDRERTGEISPWAAHIIRQLVY